MAIFSDLIEHIMEVFMDNFSVYGKDFAQCLENMEKVLKRCQETHLLPLFQNVGRFDFSRFIYFAMYLDICYI